MTKIAVPLISAPGAARGRHPPGGAKFAFPEFGVRFFGIDQAIVDARQLSTSA